MKKLLAEIAEERRFIYNIDIDLLGYKTKNSKLVVSTFLDANGISWQI